MKNWFRSLIAPCLVALLVAGAANGAVWNWSKTAATNATADPTINWAEGMSPSSVNDSARAMMAAIAAWRDDQGGPINVTAGTSSAYTITTNSGYGSLPPGGSRLTLFMHVANADGATLAVDGGPARPIWIDTNCTPTCGTPVTAGTLALSRSYSFAFCAACSPSAWVLVDYHGQPAQVPLGGIIDYVGASPPNSSFAFPNGQCISRTTYSALFALIGITYSACDGSTTFGLPDLRGRVVAGTNAMGAADSARITVAGGNFNGSTLGTAGGVQSEALTIAQLPSVTPAGGVTYTPSGTISAYTPAGTVSISQTPHSHGFSYAYNAPTTKSGQFGTSAGGAWGGADVVVNTSTFTSADTANITSSTFSGTAATLTFNGTFASATFTGTPFGSGSVHSLVQPTMVLNKLIRIL